MNRMFRLIWNGHVKTWVAAPETARGKSAGTSRLSKGTKASLQRLVVDASVPPSHDGRVLKRLTRPFLLSARGVAVSLLVASSVDANAADPVALFNDGVDGSCYPIYDSVTPPEIFYGSKCQANLGNTGSAASVGLGNGLNLVSNSQGLFLNGGLEVFGTGVAPGQPAAYIHGGLSLFSNGTTSGTANKLIGVAAGNLNANSTDAVNGSQLYGVANSTANALGGGSTVNANGTISAPSYVVGGSTFGNVGNALTNLDGRVTQNTTDIANVTNQINSGTIGLVQQATPTGTVTVAKGTGGTAVDFTGTAGTRTLSGVSAGAVNANSTDAVNGSQLYATNQAIANINNQVADAVSYDSSAHDSVTLGGAGSTNPVKLGNVAAGIVSITSTDAVDGMQLYGTAQSIANVIGGGTTVDASGKLVNTQFTVNGRQYSTVEQAIQAAAASDSTDPLAVHYDTNPDGTPNLGSVTLGGQGATTRHADQRRGRREPVRRGELRPVERSRRQGRQARRPGEQSRT